jgi:hypothetical protein
MPPNFELRTSNFVFVHAMLLRQCVGRHHVCSFRGIEDGPYAACLDPALGRGEAARMCSGFDAGSCARVRVVSSSSGSARRCACACTAPVWAASSVHGSRGKPSPADDPPD